MQLYTDTDKAIDRRYAVFAESKQRKADYILGWKQTDKTKKRERTKAVKDSYTMANENENVYLNHQSNHFRPSSPSQGTIISLLLTSPIS